MDCRFELNGLLFVWDEAKARRNVQEHDGVTFEQAAEAFFRIISARKATREERKNHDS